MTCRKRFARATERKERRRPSKKTKIDKESGFANKLWHLVTDQGREWFYKGGERKTRRRKERHL